MIRIAVDAMGGDHAPGINVKGALAALEESTNLCLTLIGPRKLLEESLAREGGCLSAQLQIAACDEVISMEDHAASAIRKKKNSSIHVGLQMVQEKKADAFLSAGNSGAVMAGALLILGRLPGVERPAILIKFPTAQGFVTLLDAGANVDCKPSHLSAFALMGQTYAEIIEGIKKPRIGLLSNGSEIHKGNEVTRQAHALLDAQKDLRYIGYVEGFDIFRNVADVVVCDGFVGNAILKVVEGMADSYFDWFRKEVRTSVLGLFGVVLLRRVLRNFKKKFDYEPYGAAPLLGINGMVLISHGSSTELAIKNGILNAKRGVEQDFTSRIAQYLGKKSLEKP